MQLDLGSIMVNEHITTFWEYHDIFDWQNVLGGTIAFRNTAKKLWYNVQIVGKIRYSPSLVGLFQFSATIVIHFLPCTKAEVQLV